MPAPEPLSDDERRDILAWHRAGYSSREIARRVGRGHSTCSRVVRESGAKTDTRQTAAATAARMRAVNDAKIDRVERLLQEADELHRGLHDPVREVISTSHGPAWVEREPSAREVKVTVDAIARLVDVAEKIMATASLDGNSERKSMMSELHQSLIALRHSGALDDKPADDGGA